MNEKDIKNIKEIFNVVDNFSKPIRDETKELTNSALSSAFSIIEAITKNSTKEEIYTKILNDLFTSMINNQKDTSASLSELKHILEKVITLITEANREYQKLANFVNELHLKIEKVELTLDRIVLHLNNNSLKKEQLSTSPRTKENVSIFAEV